MKKRLLSLLLCLIMLAGIVPAGLFSLTVSATEESGIEGYCPDIQYNKNTGTFSWNECPGAVNYILKLDFANKSVNADEVTFTYRVNGTSAVIPELLTDEQIGKLWNEKCIAIDDSTYEMLLNVDYTYSVLSVEYYKTDEASGASVLMKEDWHKYFYNDMHLLPLGRYNTYGKNVYGFKFCADGDSDILQWDPITGINYYYVSVMVRSNNTFYNYNFDKKTLSASGVPNKELYRETSVDCTGLRSAVKLLGDSVNCIRFEIKGYGDGDYRTEDSFYISYEQLCGISGTYTPTCCYWGDYETEPYKCYVNSNQCNVINSSYEYYFQLIKYPSYASLYHCSYAVEETVVYEKKLTVKDGKIQGESFDLTDYVLQNGTGRYVAVINIKDGSDRDDYYVGICDPVNGARDIAGNRTYYDENASSRLYRSKDYFYYYTQTPSPESIKTVYQYGSFNVEYAVPAPIQWMKDHGYVTTSPVIKVFDDNMNVIKTVSYGDFVNTTWSAKIDGKCTETIGNYYVWYCTYLKNGNTNTESVAKLCNIVHYEVVPQEGVSTTSDFKFTTQTGDIVVKNLVSPTITWKTNAAAPIVGIESYSESKNEWVNVSSNLGKNVSEGSYTIASRNNTYKHTRQKYRLYIKVSTETGYKYVYGKAFTVTWTNDGKEPAKVTLPSQTLKNGESYNVAVPFNYGSTGYGDNTYKTRYKLFMIDENGEKSGTAAVNCSSTNSGSTLEVTIDGEKRENSSQSFMLAIYNSSLSSDANSNGITIQNVYFTVTWEASGYILSGTVTSFGDEDDETIITAVKSDDSDISYTTTVTGNSAEYYFDNLRAGNYTVTFLKSKHVARQYTVTITDENVNQDAKIMLYGDVNADGETDNKDATQIKRYFNSLSNVIESTTDESEKAYLFKVADVNSDGEIDNKDATQIKRYFNNLSSIFDSLS